MLPLVQVCVVVVSLAVVAIAVAIMRAVVLVGRATADVSKMTGEIRLWIDEANAFTREARDTVASVQGVIAPLRHVAERFEAIGVHTADLSAAVLGEVEPPLRTALALARGAKSGANYLLERLSQRFNLGRSATNGGSDHE